MKGMDVRLGPFVLGEQLGRGGMGVVYRGTHAGSGTDVAVKVMTGERASDASYQAAFRNEVRAVAGLDHPGVVMVLDLGAVDDAAAEASGGALVSGSPWMAMELATLGTLHDIERPLPWPRLRQVLLGLLDALGHAHSRGLVHRDLKPPNILLGCAGDRTAAGPDGDGSWDGTVRLTDFGLAHAGEEKSSATNTELVTAGTPHYMAPEQFQGHWRDYGPWTDLYALGCLAWEFALGRLPFRGDNIVSLAFAHTLGERPLWDEERAKQLPPGLGAWIRRLIEREPSARFQRAADAAWALTRLEVPEALWEADAPVGGEHHSSVAELTPASETFYLTVDSVTPSSFGGAIGDGDEDGGGLGPVGAAAGFGGATARVTTLIDLDESEELDFGGSDVPPIPETWRPPSGDRPSPQLRGAGLGLFGLRAVPIVGRRQIRDQLWGALKDAGGAGKPRALLLHGPAGTGKSALAGWLGRRAHEVGAATVLRSADAAIAGPEHGVEAMFARHLRLVGLDLDATLERLEGMLAASGVASEGEARELAAILTPADAGGAAGADVGIAWGRRHDALIAALGHLGAERPVVLHLDDVAHSDDTIGFLTRLLTGPPATTNPDGTLPVLVVATARDDDLAAMPADRAEALDAVFRADRTGRLEIGPLPDGDRRALVTELLGFDDALAARIDERTGGNPLFAVQLVGDQVARGVLVPGADGIRLADGAELRLPDDLHDVARQRLRTATADLAEAEPAWAALQAAAALGDEVDLGEWTQVCLDAKIAAPLTDVAERLLHAKLAVPSDRGFTFASAILRESLERSAAEDGRRADLHRACAAMLRTLGGDGADVERIGLHLLAAGDDAGALAPLLAGARRRQARSDPGGVLALLERRDRAAARVVPPLPADDPRRGAGRALAAWAHRALGNLDRAEALAAAAEGDPSPPVAAEAALVRAQVAHARGDFEASATLHRRARLQCRDAGLEREATQAIQGLADVALRRGAAAEADELFARAADLFARQGRTVEQADNLRARALCARRLERPAQALDLLRQALALYEAAGNRRGMGDTLNSLAELARAAGRRTDAEEGYRRALALHEATGVGGVMPRINLALLLLGQDRMADAARVLDPAIDRLRRTGRKGLLGCALATSVPCRAAERRWGAFDKATDEARALLRSSSIAEADVAEALELGGRLAAFEGEPRRAADAWALAVEQWRGAGRTDHADRLASERAALPDA